jgi:hypothetical protein
VFERRITSDQLIPYQYVLGKSATIFLVHFPSINFDQGADTMIYDEAS